MILIGLMWQQISALFKFYVISFVFKNALSIKYQGEVFVKITKFPGLSVPISNIMADSTHTCAAFCMQVKTCSMIMLTSKGNNMSRACSIYGNLSPNIIDDNKNLSIQHNLAVWYKMEKFLELSQQSADLTKPEEFVISTTHYDPLTTATACPSPCIEIGFGCYCTHDTEVGWDDGNIICQDMGDRTGQQGTLAVFDSISVRIVT